MIDFTSYSYSVTERFVRYAKIDTQSDPNSVTCPSTAKQKNLSRLLVEELKSMGIADAELDEHGYVYATIPATTEKQVPVICFCSHVDTSPDCSGENVNPQMQLNYQGNDIVLKNDSSQVIRFAEHPALKRQIGNDIITTDGTTLLGADNKAGVAEIMDAANFLMQHPEIKHGKVRILFTPDEEIGRGVDKCDMNKLGADFGYTVDGETLGQLENETFSADGVQVVVRGFPTHPGFAKNKMENSMKIASEIISRLPKNKTPETTEGKQGFIHPVSVSGTLEETKINFIIRDFSVEGLHSLEAELKEIVMEVFKAFSKSTFSFQVTEQYRNMKSVLDQHPEVVEFAAEAIRRSGVEPIITSIRGGTDGSRLSFMGLPCPNIFAGEHAFHSKLEWVSVQDMQKAVQTIVNLVAIWEEKS
jgi:tripeptide aminopeptidase